MEAGGLCDLGQATTLPGLLQHRRASEERLTMKKQCT